MVGQKRARAQGVKVCGFAFTALASLFSTGVLNPAFSQSADDISKSDSDLEVIANVRGWDIAYVRSGACFGFGEFRSGTSILVGKKGAEGAWTTVVSNPSWKSIKEGEYYEVVWVFDGRRSWSSKEVGTKGGFRSDDIKPEFIEDFSSSSRLAIKFRENVVDQFSLHGTRAALSAIEECYNTRVRPSDPFASVGPSSGNQDVGGTLPYGSRVGMEVSIVSLSGLDTSNAMISTRHTRDNAMRFCREYIGRVTDECIREELSTELKSQVTGDCQQGSFTDLYGRRFEFLGRNNDRGLMADFAIRDPETREILEDNSASGYAELLAIFEALCPVTVANFGEEAIGELALGGNWREEGETCGDGEQWTLEQTPRGWTMFVNEFSCDLSRPHFIEETIVEFAAECRVEEDTSTSGKLRFEVESSDRLRATFPDSKTVVLNRC